MDMRTPLGRVRGLGSAKDGTEHFWRQRVTAVANVFLITFFVILLLRLQAGTYAELRAAFANPFVAVVMALIVISATIHMRLGMQVIIEDYIHSGLRLVLQIANTFFAIGIAAASLFAIVILYLGA